MIYSIIVQMWWIEYLRVTAPLSWTEVYCGGGTLESYILWLHFYVTKSVLLFGVVELATLQLGLMEMTQRKDIHIPAVLTSPPCSAETEWKYTTHSGAFGAANSLTSNKRHCSKTNLVKFSLLFLYSVWGEEEYSINEGSASDYPQRPF